MTFSVGQNSVAELAGAQAPGKIHHLTEALRSNVEQLEAKMKEKNIF